MEGLDYWRLCDELNVVQAALLLVDCDPGDGDGYVEDWEMHNRPRGYEAAKTAIVNALRRGAIEGRVEPLWGPSTDGDERKIEDSVDLVESRVEVESLREWLASRGLRTGFFFPGSTDAPDYLDPNNPRYAPKLAAAIQAWLAIIDPGGKSPKQALLKWLREHAADFGLTDDDGKLNDTGIEEAAKVANWQPSGGAPKTPGE